MADSNALYNGDTFLEGINISDVQNADTVETIEVSIPLSPSTSLFGDIQHQDSSNTP